MTEFESSATSVLGIPAPFDQISEHYDEAFSNTLLGRWLREQVWERLDANFKPGDHVLELGCGTGEDAIWLAQKGVRVTATDRSQAMLEVAQRKIHEANLGRLVQTQFLDLNQLDVQLATTYDGVLANFGGLNCVRDRPGLAEFLSRRVRNGGTAVFVVMNPYCPWEMLWYLSHAQARQAFRRFRHAHSVVRLKEPTRPDVAKPSPDFFEDGSGTTTKAKAANSLPTPAITAPSRGSDRQAGTLCGTAVISVWYPKPHEVRKDFSADFRFDRLAGLGVFLPPTYLKRLVEKHPRVFDHFKKLDQKISNRFPCNRLNDHYILELVRN